jgi:hypothetical protein
MANSRPGVLHLNGYPCPALMPAQIRERIFGNKYGDRGSLQAPLLGCLSPRSAPAAHCV